MRNTNHAGRKPCHKNKKHAYNCIDNPLHNNMRVAWLGLADSNLGRVRVGHYRRPCENGQMTVPGGFPANSKNIEIWNRINML